VRRAQSVKHDHRHLQTADVETNLTDTLLPMRTTSVRFTPEWALAMGLGGM
jgi:hypothetical protein